MKAIDTLTEERMHNDQMGMQSTQNSAQIGLESDRLKHEQQQAAMTALQSATAKLGEKDVKGKRTNE